MDWVLQREVCWDFRILTQAIYKLPYRIGLSLVLQLGLAKYRPRLSWFWWACGSTEQRWWWWCAKQTSWKNLTRSYCGRLLVVVWCDGSNGLLSLFSLCGCKGFGDLIVASGIEVSSWLQNLGFFFFFFFFGWYFLALSCGDASIDRCLL